MRRSKLSQSQAQICPYMRATKCITCLVYIYFVTSESSTSLLSPETCRCILCSIAIGPEEVRSFAVICCMSSLSNAEVVQQFMVVRGQSPDWGIAILSVSTLKVTATYEHVRSPRSDGHTSHLSKTTTTQRRAQRAAYSLFLEPHSSQKPRS